MDSVPAGGRPSGAPTTSNGAPGATSALRHHFIATANQLAKLYSSAAASESSAREAGERQAFLSMMEWAAKRRRTGEPVDAQAVLEFASERLGDIASRAQPPAGNMVVSGGGGFDGRTDRQGSALPSGSSNPTSGGTCTMSTMASNACANDTNGIPGNGGDSLASGIRKLQVNPRKRQRIDAGDMFLNVWHEETLAQTRSSSDPLVLYDGSDSSEKLSSPLLISASGSGHGDASAQRKAHRKAARDMRTSRRKDEE